MKRSFLRTAVNRRGFLKLGGIIGAAMAAAKALPGGVKTADRMLEPEIDRDLREAWHPSSCSLCPAGCGVLYRMDDDQPVGVKGDPKDTVTAGAVCLKAFGLLQEYAHPDRLLAPQERRETGTFAPTVWDAAVAKAGAWLKGARRPAVLLGPEATASSALVARFAGAMGADLYRSAWTPADLPLDALRAATGYPDAKPDFDRSDLVLSFGQEWLLQSGHAALAGQAYGRLRPRTGLGRARLVIVSSRLGLTGIKSDLWIACAPRMEGAVALAVAGLLARSGRVKGPAGAWARRVADDLPPERLARESAVPMEKIRALAEELGRSTAPLVLGSRGRLADQWAVVGLAAAAGSLGRPGGIYPAPAAGFHESGAPAAQPAEDLFERLRGGKDPVDVLVIHGANPAFASPEPSRWRSVLRQVPHIVTIGSFMDETAGLSHLVLPAALFAEREDAVVGRSAGRARVRHTAAAIPPRAGVWSVAEIVAGLARASGRARGFPAPGDGVRRFLRALVRSGAPAASTSLHPRADLAAALAAAPRWTSPQPAAEREFRLRLLFVPAFSYGYGAHLPYLLSTTAPILRTWWYTVAELNPESARALKIADRDQVELVSASGRIVATAKVYEGVPPGEVAVSFGLGRGPDGALTRGKGMNPAELVAFRREAGAESGLWDHGTVRVARLGGA